MLIVILPCPGEVIPICRGILRLCGDGDIPFRPGIGDLHLVRQQVLDEKPGGQDLIGILLVENADGGPLGDHPRRIRVQLGDGQHRRLEIHHLVGADVHQGRVGADPGGAAGGIQGEDALARIEEVAGVAGDLEGGKGARTRMLRDGVEEFLRIVVEQQDIPRGGGIPAALLLAELDQHIVGGIVDATGPSA